MLRFHIFEDAAEVHAIERGLLRVVDWRVAVSADEFQQYDTAVLKPLLIAMKDETRPWKKRKSITIGSDEEYDALGCDDGEFDDTATTCSMLTPPKLSAVSAPEEER